MWRREERTRMVHLPLLPPKKNIMYHKTDLVHFFFEIGLFLLDFILV